VPQAGGRMVFWLLRLTGWQLDEIHVHGLRCSINCYNSPCYPLQWATIWPDMHYHSCVSMGTVATPIPHLLANTRNGLGPLSQAPMTSQTPICQPWQQCLLLKHKRSLANRRPGLILLILTQCPWA
jgi:hypothetical protein